MNKDGTYYNVISLGENVNQPKILENGSILSDGILFDGANDYQMQRKAPCFSYGDISCRQRHL